MSKQGKLLIISGFSGVGKGTVVNKLIDKYDDYTISISATTRKPRVGEVDKVNYFFVSKEEFEDMIANNKLLEYAQYVDNYYGTPLEFVNEKLNEGINVILEIETQGALKVKEIMPEAMMIFILPPSAEELKKRLVGRNTESMEVINKRLMKAAEETIFMDNYEYFVINDEIEGCVEKINLVVNNDTTGTASKKEVEEIKNDIKKFSKGE
ncbi:guanylate kinase [Eubacterium sp. AF19-12LB]|uniref:guanylate kinase n=1 Tax=Eubacterium sp. AF19-12LB TaxID=2293106 RepID=UPI000E5231AB|nr:guanylate kinase [Eubacterium sp. AF19-12LB]RHR36654.1 guanylate kinase [Eubacterium sp. AF19-12LB]